MCELSILLIENRTHNKQTSTNIIELIIIYNITNIIELIILNFLLAILYLVILIEFMFDYY